MSRAIWPIGWASRRSSMSAERPTIRRPKAKSSAGIKRSRTESCLSTTTCPAISNAKSPPSWRTTTMPAITRASTILPRMAPTSDALRPSSSNAKGSSAKHSQTVACSINCMPHNLNPDDPEPPFWKPAICLKSPDDGQCPALREEAGNVSSFTGRPRQKLLVIVPLLSEIERYQRALPAFAFKDPSEYRTKKLRKQCHGKKFYDLVRLVENGENIITTHSLFSKMDRDLYAKIQAAGYEFV